MSKIPIFKTKLAHPTDILFDNLYFEFVSIFDIGISNLTL